MTERGANQRGEGRVPEGRVGRRCASSQGVLSLSKGRSQLTRDNASHDQWCRRRAAGRADATGRSHGDAPPPGEAAAPSGARRPAVVGGAQVGRRRAGRVRRGGPHLSGARSRSGAPPLRWWWRARERARLRGRPGGRNGSQNGPQNGPQLPQPTSGVFLGVATQAATGGSRAPRSRTWRMGAPPPAPGSRRVTSSPPSTGLRFESCRLAQPGAQPPTRRSVTITYSRGGNSTDAPVQLGDRSAGTHPRRTHRPLSPRPIGPRTLTRMLLDGFNQWLLTKDTAAARVLRGRVRRVRAPRRAGDNPRAPTCACRRPRRSHRAQRVSRSTGSTKRSGRPHVRAGPHRPLGASRGSLERSRRSAHRLMARGAPTARDRFRADP